MFVQSEEFILAHGGKKDDISIFGQESNPTTWKLAAMNLTLRGLTANLGTKNANTFHEDLHKDKKFDFILANPPFNISDWGQELLLDDYRWKYGTPPQGNANYAWLQHIISKLSTNGRAGVVLANGSLTSNTGGEDKIRQKLVEEGVGEAIVAMPANLFFGVTISCSLWFLSKNKTREDEVLFIDAKKLGHMETKVIRNFSNDDIDLIHKTVESWRSNNKFKNITGFCKSVHTEEIKNNKYTLNPGKYVDIDTDLISEDNKRNNLVN